MDAFRKCHANGQVRHTMLHTTIALNQVHAVYFKNQQSMKVKLKYDYQW